jgi:hypothetical protein
MSLFLLVLRRFWGIWFFYFWKITLLLLFYWLHFLKIFGHMINIYSLSYHLLMFIWKYSFSSFLHWLFRLNFFILQGLLYRTKYSPANIDTWPRSFPKNLIIFMLKNTFSHSIMLSIGFKYYFNSTITAIKVLLLVQEMIIAEYINSTMRRMI